MITRIYYIIFVLCLLTTVVFAAEKAPQKVIDLAKSTLAAYGTDAVIVKAVKAENAKNKSLADIKAMDERWRNTPGIVNYMKEFMTSECGNRLKAIINSKAYFAEIFVMDNQGANVAMTDKTSDYWQGDEEKFIQSFKNGQGGIHISDVEFDDSTQLYIVQVSVPVKDGAKVIGAITFGIDVDNL